ncbi:hypothetical protein MIMGU_mgv11b024087mg [Erythranthe guttata]|uniref:Secreted protein n=1 Tax=Erythranthe guttata TaxID=4155 RepID=A0A022QVK3_ERYGU|nr:hypothetical protein MIMGU_mgv11b024087mg [Erythranthe guttata]
MRINVLVLYFVFLRTLLRMHFCACFFTCTFVHVHLSDECFLCTFLDAHSCPRTVAGIFMIAVGIQF